MRGETLPPDGLICFGKWLAITLFPYLEAWACHNMPHSAGRPRIHPPLARQDPRRNVRNRRAKRKVLDCDGSVIPHPLPRLRSWKKTIFFFFLLYLQIFQLRVFYIPFIFARKMRNVFGIGMGT